ncbi:rhomboid family intramembrane serine protease [Arcanobacterium phocae]|uniref:rhomboid family intramembrane serine protease n=1 Tax=Arcanobacterium phocae TaxID=131112 RepID=UPI001C0EC435|nr:rhomboid family intramembrane serine protease [Arcanobacterium phocae]
MSKLNIPPVTAFMGAVCIAASLLTYVYPQTLYDYAFVPFLAEAEPWRFLTGAFLHAGLLHIGFNVLSLIFLGNELEPALKSSRFAVLYIASALGGNAGVYAWALWTNEWNIAAVGASGSIFGLFGALVVLTRALRTDPRGIIALLVINVLIVFTNPQISWQAHLGGFLTGLVLTAIWWPLHRRRQKSSRSGW